MKHIPIIFAILLAVAAFGVLLFFETRKEPPVVVHTDLTPAHTWMLEDALDEVSNVPDLQNSASDASALKKEVMITSLAGGGNEMSEEEADFFEEFAAFDFDNSNLPDFMKNMTEEERAEFQKYMRATFSKMYRRIAQRAEKKKKERLHEKAVKDSFKKMKFNKEQRGYIAGREKEVWDRIQETMKYAKKSRWKKDRLQEELKMIRKSHRQDMDEYLGGKKYSSYLDTVKRTEDPSYANRSDISALQSKVASLEKIVKSLQTAMSKKGVQIRQTPKKKPPKKKPKSGKKKPPAK
ncbi:MAG: hypothetical protein ACYS8W_21240 [Planctomycetota bacterium]|jgi:hypothetical protein